MRVHVVGNLCRDTTLAVARFPVPGETLVAASSAVGLGGKGLNQAVAAARAGAPATLHAAVGSADAGALAGALSGEPGLALQLAGLDDTPTDTSTILVRGDGENLIVSATACARAFDPAPGLGPLGRGDVLVMQGNLGLGPTRACLAAGRRAGALTVLNPSPVFEDGTPDWADVDLTVLNRGELAALTGTDDPDRGALALLARGAGAVAVTLGPLGALFRSATEAIAAPAPAVAARDTSGAGDVFCGVLAGLLWRGLDRRDALARAVAAASLSVTRAGALASCPSAAEIAALPPQTLDRSRP